MVKQKRERNHVMQTKAARLGSDRHGEWPAPGHSETILKYLNPPSAHLRLSHSLAQSSVQSICLLPVSPSSTLIPTLNHHDCNASVTLRYCAHIKATEYPHAVPPTDRS